MFWTSTASIYTSAVVFHAGLYSDKHHRLRRRPHHHDDHITTASISHYQCVHTMTISPSFSAAGDKHTAVCPEQQLTDVPYLGAADCLWKTVANEGFGGLYKGWSAHFLRVAPHTVLTFVLLEALKSRFAKPSSSAANAPPHRSVADKQ